MIEGYEYSPRRVEFDHNSFGTVVCHPNSYVNRLIYEGLLNLDEIVKKDEDCGNYGVENGEIKPNIGRELYNMEPVSILKGFYTHFLKGWYKLSDIEAVLSELCYVLPDGRNLYLSELNVTLATKNRDNTNRSGICFGLMMDKRGKATLYKSNSLSLSLETLETGSILKTKRKLLDLIQQLRESSLKNTKPLIEEEPIFITQELREITDDLDFSGIEKAIGFLYQLEK